jgi:predicted ATPase
MTSRPSADAASRLPPLLRAAPGLDLVVTSRVRLAVEEEHLLPIAGMAYPATDVAWPAALEYEAVRLFAERARQLRPDVPLAAETDHVLALCRHLQGLPLGLELAASWVRLLSCAEIADEVQSDLDFLAAATPTVSERHRSVRGMLEASWRLLDDRERDVLRRLGVFRGGFRREAASEVAGATLVTLVGLVDKSLLRVSDGGRYDRHPLLAQFTREQLARVPAELAEARTRHAAYVLALAEHADRLLRTPEQVTWFARLSEEQGNVSAALETLSAEADGEQALRLAVALDALLAHARAGASRFRSAAGRPRAHRGATVRCGSGRWRLAAECAMAAQ